MNCLYQHIANSTNEIFDTKVYRDVNPSLRLPMCVKIKEKEIEERPLTIVSDSKFKDFIISDTRYCNI